MLRFTTLLGFLASIARYTVRAEPLVLELLEPSNDQPLDLSRELIELKWDRGDFFNDSVSFNATLNQMNFVFREESNETDRTRSEVITRSVNLVKLDEFRASGGLDVYSYAPGFDIRNRWTVSDIRPLFRRESITIQSGDDAAWFEARFLINRNDTNGLDGYWVRTQSYSVSNQDAWHNEEEEESGASSTYEMYQCGWAAIVASAAVGLLVAT